MNENRLASPETALAMFATLSCPSHGTPGRGDPRHSQGVARCTLIPSATMQAPAPRLRPVRSVRSPSVSARLCGAARRVQ
jgi:hypothetical protein